MLREQFTSLIFSHVYRTAPQDITDQPEFLNAVARIETALSPEDLLTALQAIEKRLGKNPPFPKGPRTIDLDLLLYGTCVQEGPPTLPHPRMYERRFVLEPLCELLAKTHDQACDQTTISL